MRSLIALFWVTVAVYAVEAFGFVSMAVDGFDYSSGLMPGRGSLAWLGATIADVTLLVGWLSMAVTWVVMSSWAVSIRGRIPITWRHSNAGVWLWWLVPVAAFWKPRDVYLELARAARPGSREEIDAIVNRWWLAFVLFQFVANIRYLVGGPTYLAAISVGLLALVSVAAIYATRLVKEAGSPTVTYDTAADQGGALPRQRAPEPTVPGWYYDPSGRVSHQAYWDGGQWTGVTRPDPMSFPAQPGGGGEADGMRKWFIALAIVLTLAWTAAVVALVDAEDAPVDRFALARVEEA